MADRRSSRQQSRPQSRQSYEQNVGRNGGAASGSSYTPSRAAGASSYSRKRQSRQRKIVLRGVLIGLLCVVLAGGTALAAYLMNINNQLSSGLDQQTKDLLADSVQYDDPFYMLLLGVDKSQERMESEEYGEADSNYRADSIILARIDPKAQTVTLVSLHRDTMTDMSDKNMGTQKLNAAYAIGGASYMITCVEKLCGVDISHYAYDDYGDGDVYRAANQRMVISAIVKKVLTLDVASMTNAVSQLAGGVTTDINISDILGLAVQFKDLDVENNVYSGMEPTSGYYTNDTWYEKIDETAWNTMMERVRAGEPPLADETSAETYGVTGTLVSDGSGGSASTSTETTSSSSSSSDEAEYSGTACVVNVSGISGAAGEKSELLSNAGFTSEATNGTSPLTVSKVVYNGSSSKAKAVGAAKTLGISESNVEQNDGTWSTDYDVVVVLCSDKA